MSDDILANDPRRIVVLRALYLGDLLCATPAFHALRRRFPEAEITLIGLPWAEKLVRRLPSLDQFLTFPGYTGIPESGVDPHRTQVFLDEARSTGYDLAVQMHGDGRTSNGFVADLGARFSLGYRRLDDSRLSISLPWVADEPEIERWLRLVGEVGADTCDTRIDFPRTPVDHKRARNLLAQLPPGDEPLVGLHAGASSPLRRWPPARFAELADALSERWNARIVLTGTAQERSITQQVRQLANTSILDLAGYTDLGAFAAVIEQLDLLVTNDTGALHLAAASTTPSVAIFSVASAYQWAPLDHDRHLIVDARSYAPAELPPVDALAQLPIEPVLLACERHLGADTESG